MLNFESLIDPTHFGTVRRYLNRPGSPITDCLFVEDPKLLAPVAELLTDEPVTAAKMCRLQAWMKDGRIKLGVNATVEAGTSDGEGVVDVHSVPDDTWCQVLFLPPFYLVHRARL